MLFRSTDPAVHPFLQRLLNGQIALDIDATSSILGFSRQIRLGENIGEFAVALLGVIVVLILGSIWRARALRHETVPSEA